MSQDVFSSINPSTTSGTQLAAILDDFKDAVMSGLSGTSRPPQTTAGGYWVDTTNEGSPNFYWKFMLYTGSVDVEVFRVNLSTGKASISGTDSTFEVSRTSADQVGALFTFLKSRVANDGQVLDGDEIGELRFSVKNDDGDTMVVATMRAIASDDATDAAAGAYLVWETTPDGTASAVEHMRLINGRLGIGTQTPETNLHVAGSLGIKSDYTADSANGAQLSLQKGRSSGNGSTQNNDVIGDLNFRTTDNATAKSTSARVRASATQAHTSTAQGTKLEVQTAETGTATPTTKVTVGPDDIETNFPLKVNAQQLIIQDVATSATINQLSAAKTIVRFTGSTATSVRGLNSAHASKTVVLHNASSASVTIEHENSNASAADRITLPDSSPITISPSSSVELFYSPTDTRWKLKSGSGTGSGSGSGGKNYASTLFDGKTVNGLNVYDDGASAVPVDGTGGSPAAITVALNTSSPLRGSSNIRISKSAADGQGEGVSYDFTLDRTDARSSGPIVIQFPYETSSNYAGGDIRVFVYDRDATRLLNVLSLTGDGSIAASANSTLFTGVFYPYSSTSQDYRLIFHVTSTNASAWTFDFINLRIGPESVVPGTITTAPSTYTPNFQGFGTVANIAVQYWREGVNLRIMGRFTTGTTTAVEAQMSLPTGLTSSSSIVSLENAGTMISTSNLAGSFYVLREPSKSYVTFGLSNASFAALGKQNGNGILGNTITVSIDATVPIEGWTATTTLSTTDTMLMGAKFSAAKTSSQTVSSTSLTKVTGWTVSKDNVVRWDATNNRYVVPRAGRYNVTGSLSLSNTTAAEAYFVHIYVNGSSVRRQYSQAATATNAVHAELDLNAGDYVEIFVKSNADTSYDVITDDATFFSVTEFVDPTIFSVYGVSEVQNAILQSGSAISLTSATPANIVSLTLQPGEWDLTAMAGIYLNGNGTRVAASISSVSATHATEPLDGGYTQLSWPSGALSNQIVAVPTTTKVISVPTTFYLVGSASFTTSTATAFGSLKARRIK